MVDVSVIMPAYNAERYIREAIDSILKQKFLGSFEILIVDDNSSDSTLDIITEYENSYRGIIKVYHNESNIGCSNSSILLCQKSSGNYLAFCDADDIWIDENKLQFQYEFLESHCEYGLHCSEAVSGKSIGQGINYKHTSGGGKILSFEELIYEHADIFNSSVLMRKSLYQKMLLDCKWYQDNNCFFDTVWAYWFSLNSAIWKSFDKTVFYRILPNSDCHSTDNSKRHILEKRYFMIKSFFVLNANIGSDMKLDILSKEYDYLYENAKYEGNCQVRTSKSYKIGKRITSFLKCFSIVPK